MEATTTETAWCGTHRRLEQVVKGEMAAEQVRRAAKEEGGVQARVQFGCGEGTIILTTWERLARMRRGIGER